jgi:hypothetical protein
VSVVIAPVYEVILSGSTWTDITADVVDGDVDGKYGVDGSGPIDEIASTGQFTFKLRNDAQGTRPLGYYSPSNVNCRSGWLFGIPFRFRILYLGVYYTRFRGKLRVILPDTGPYARRQVVVTAYDYMRDLAEFDLQAISIQVNQSEAQVITNVLASLPAESQPVATDIDAGIDVFPWALDKLGTSTKAMSVISDVARSSYYFVAIKGDGTLIGRNRTSRATGVAMFSFLGDANDVIVPSDLSNVYNLVRVTIHPRTIDATATTVLYELVGDGLPIGAGLTVTVFGAFTDATNAQRLIGGTATVTPIVATTDYLGNSASDGSGSDQTASLSIVTTAFATTAMFEITNTSGATVYVTKLQIRGKGVYDLGPQTFVSSSTQPYGTRPIDIDMPYQSDPLIAQSSAEYLQAVYAGSTQQVQELKFIANVSAAKMLFALTVEPGDLIALTEVVTGVNATVVVQSVSFTLAEKVLTYTLGLAPTGSFIFSFWHWGIVGESEWGQTTVYGF